MLDFVIRVNKEYYPQTLLKECKYDIKKNKMQNNINHDFDSSSSDKSNNEPKSESNSQSNGVSMNES